MSEPSLTKEREDTTMMHNMKHYPNPVKLDTDYEVNSFPFGLESGRFVPTGYQEVNKYATIKTGTVTVIGAREGMGKTAVALNIVSNVHDFHDFPILYLSNVEFEEQLVNRLVALHCDISQEDVRKKDLRPTEKDDLLEEAHYLMDGTISFLYDPHITLERLRNDLLLGENSDVSLLIIDEVQYMARANHMPLKQFIASLKCLAVETDVAIICLYEVPSEVLDHRNDHWPHYYHDDFLDFSHADNIISVYHRSFYESEAPEEEMAFCVEKSVVPEGKAQPIFYRWNPQTHRLYDVKLMPFSDFGEEWYPPYTTDIDGQPFIDDELDPFALEDPDLDIDEEELLRYGNTVD